jgi:hypothetical protein
MMLQNSTLNQVYWACKQSPSLNERLSFTELRVMSDLHIRRRMVEANFLTVWSYCNLSEPTTNG